MDKEKELPAPKCIGCMAFKSTGTDGNPCKTYVWIMSNCVVNINQLILSHEVHLEGFKPLTTRFGKTLHVTAIGFKWSSLNTIHMGVLAFLKKNEKKVTEIL